MIDIAKLTESDKGRGVVYVPRVGPYVREDGVITSWNARFVFVKYRGTHPAVGGQATDPRDLEWP